MERKYKSDFQVKLAHHFAYAPVEALHGQRSCSFPEIYDGSKFAFGHTARLVSLHAERYEFYFS